MLKYRIITSLILLPIFVTLLFVLPPAAFCFLTGLFILVGAYEWSAFIGVNRFPLSLFYPIVLFFMLWGSLHISMFSILIISFVWWIIAFLLVVLYPKLNFLWAKSTIIRAIMGLLVLIPCWLAINFIRNVDNGTYILLFLFILIWGADIAAYFVGGRWGKHHLLPLVSPGKTWQGLGGALTMAVIIAMVALFMFKTPYTVWPAAISLALITVLFSVLGDLFESMLKRNVGLKDSGQILPGHGGVLDRIDSLTAAAPIFTIGAMLIGKYFH